MVASVQQHLLGSLLNVLSLADDHPRTIGITSSHRGEGVSTVTRLVGHTVSCSPETETLLVDANLYDPSLHQAERIPRSPGFGDLLTQGVWDQWVSWITTRESLNLSILPAGSAVENLPWAYIRPIPSTFVESLRERFAYVLFDLPPVHECPEGILFAKKLDAVIFVVRAHHTPMKAAEVAVGLLKQGGVRLLGGILNRKKYFIPRFLYERL